MKKIMRVITCFFLFGLLAGGTAFADEVVQEVDQELIMADGLNCPCKTEVEVPPPPPPPPPAPVSEGPFYNLYVGGGYGASMLDGCEEDDCLDPTNSHDNITAHDQGYKFFGGVRLFEYFGIEGGYYDLGQGIDDDSHPDEYDVTGAALSGLAYLPIDEKTRLFAKGGVFWGNIFEYDNAGSGNVPVSEESGISPIVGAGGEFQISDSFLFRGEVEWIPHVADGNIGSDETGDIDALFTSVSLVWNLFDPSPSNPLLSPGSDLSSLNGLYIGGGVSGVSWDGGEELRNNGNFADIVTDIDVGAKAFVGYRFCRYCAVEVGYHYLADAGDDDGDTIDTFDAQGVSLSVMSLFPVSDRTTIFFKAGGIYGWLDEFDGNNSPSSTFGTRFGEDGLGLLLGGGLNFDLAHNISLRGELEFMPNFADGRAGNNGNPDDQDHGETADVDIIATSASLIWWFR